MGGIRSVEPTLLQVAVAAFGCVPVAAGGAGIVMGASFAEAQELGASLDSHVRYLSGLLLAVGLGFWSAIPEIETKTQRFRLLTVIVAVGGLGRLIGLAVAGLPPTPTLFALVMELGVTPALWLWQGRIAARSCRGSAVG